MESTTDLLVHFSKLEEPRVDRTKRYPLIEIIFLAICATVSGWVLSQLWRSWYTVRSN